MGEKHRNGYIFSPKQLKTINAHRFQQPTRHLQFTSFSGSGKSAISNVLEKELFAQGNRTYILAGDNLRQGPNCNFWLNDSDRVENIRRAAEVAKLMMNAGLIVMTGLISPFRQENELARSLIGSENFVEVFVATPLA